MSLISQRLDNIKIDRSKKEFMMSNDFTTIYILSSKIEFDVEVVHKITDDTIHKLHEVATIPRAS